MPLPETTSTPSARNLWLRIASAAILAPLAIGAAYLGEWPFTIFWLAAAIAVWWEWVGLIDPAGRHVVLATGCMRPDFTGDPDRDGTCDHRRSW